MAGAHRGDRDGPDPGDLAARVDRLEAAVAAAGELLVEAGAGRSAGRIATRGTPTSPAAKGIRTVVQLAVASIPSLGLGAALDSQLAVWIGTLVLAPVVAYAQNALEDAHKVTAFLRDVGDGPAPVTAGRDLAP